MGNLRVEIIERYTSIYDALDCNHACPVMPGDFSDGLATDALSRTTMCDRIQAVRNKWLEA